MTNLQTQTNVTHGALNGGAEHLDRRAEIGASPMAVMRDFIGVRVETQHPLAAESPDHLSPKGTRFDRSRNERFSRKIRRLFRGVGPQIRVLDLGCAGGSFVQEWVDGGHFAVGLEGSDYSQTYRRAAWAAIPHLLATCDVSHPFRVHLQKREGEVPLDFHLVTAWELLEHLTPDQLVGLCGNVKTHLCPEGLFIGSICPSPAKSWDGASLHQTVQPESWWDDFFAKQGLTRRRDIEAYFNRQFVRGGVMEKRREGGSFAVVLAHADAPKMELPPQKRGEKLADRWFHSRAHRFLRWAVTGGDVEN